MASPILMPSTDLRSLTVLEIAQRLQFVERDAGLVDGGLRVRDRGGAGFRHKVFHGLRGRAQVGCRGAELVLDLGVVDRRDRRLELGAESVERLDGLLRILRSLLLRDVQILGERLTVGRDLRAGIDDALIARGGLGGG